MNLAVLLACTEKAKIIGEFSCVRYEYSTASYDFLWGFIVSAPEYKEIEILYVEIAERSCFLRVQLSDVMFRST
jgi:hypothetical protein